MHRVRPGIKPHGLRSSPVSSSTALRDDAARPDELRWLARPSHKESTAQDLKRVDLRAWIPYPCQLCDPFPQVQALGGFENYKAGVLVRPVGEMLARLVLEAHICQGCATTVTADWRQLVKKSLNANKAMRLHAAA